MAALSVIYFHIAEFYQPDNDFERHLFYLIVARVDLGKIAVTVFFAISGFVIPFSLFKPSATPLRDFAISRFFRLYPAYWLSVFFAISLSSIFAGFRFHLATILVNMTMLQQFIGVQNVIGVYWTLQIELIFYALSAAMFSLGLLQKPKAVIASVWICLFFALILGIGRHVTGKNLPVALPLALSVMYFGFLWRSFVMQDVTAQRDHISAILAGFVVLLPPILYLAYDQGHGEGLKYVLTYYTSIGLFVLGTTKLKLTSGTTAYLGKISYSLYLISAPMTVAADYLLVKYWGTCPIVGLVILTTVLSIVSSGLIYRFIEAPSIAVGRRLSQPAREPTALTKRQIKASEVL